MWPIALWNAATIIIQFHTAVSKSSWKHVRLCHTSKHTCTLDFSAGRFIQFNLSFSFGKLFNPGGGMQPACLCLHAGQRPPVSFHPQKSKPPSPPSCIYRTWFIPAMYTSAFTTLFYLYNPNKQKPGYETNIQMIQMMGPSDNDYIYIDFKDFKYNQKLEFPRENLELGTGFFFFWTKGKFECFQPNLCVVQHKININTFIVISLIIQVLWANVALSL